MSNLYCTRESLKAALQKTGSDSNALIDRHLEGASREIDNGLGVRHGYFIPKTETRLYDWPQDRDVSPANRDGKLRLDEGLISVSTLTSQNGAVTIAAADFILKPSNERPYTRIEIDGATTTANAYFASNTTAQEAISVAGSWGYAATTVAAGALAEADDGSETALDVTDSSLIDVGDTILIGAEQMFVSEKVLLDTTANMTTTMTADTSETTVAVNDGTLVKQGEVIQIESERMYVQSISGNNLTVKRAYDGTVLAAHTQPIDVYAYRTLTVTRGENGTTAASHSSAAAILKYQPPMDIQNLCRAQAIFSYLQDESGQTGVVGGIEGSVNVSPRDLNAMWARVKDVYHRPLSRIL